jgi:TRAP-type C4-dicarboxylate transport system substrate-binding protein
MRRCCWTASFGFGLAMLIFLASMPVSGHTAERLVFGHILEESTAHHRHLLWAAGEIERSLKGRYRLDVVPRGQLGVTDAQVIEGFNRGVAQMAYLSLGHLPGIYDPLSIGAGPFVFRDFEHWTLFANSTLFKELVRELENRAGLKVFGLAYYGERHVTTKTPLSPYDHVKGLAIRVPSIPIIVLSFRALGGRPVQIPFKETYQALKEGIVDAQENPLPAIKAMRFYEVTKVVNLTAHIADAQLLVMDGKRWMAVDKKDQPVMAAIFEEAARRVTSDVRQEEVELKDWLLKAGAEFHRIDRERMIKQIQPFHQKEGYFPWPGPLYDRIQALR